MAAIYHRRFRFAGRDLYLTRQELYERTKRIFDLSVATILLILLSPLMALIALAIKLDSPGPVLFIQKRVGRGGRLFDFYKFRSMSHGGNHDEAHRAFSKQYINGVEDETQIKVFKPQNGHGVTRIGRILRKTSLDELPQLVNVIKGDMSLVGPRPSVWYELEEYADWHYRRLDVLPGITGLAQINGRSSIRFKEIVRIDIQYIENRSFWLDLKILLKTIPVVLSGKAAG